MIPIPSGMRVWLPTGHTDMRKGFDGLALLVQESERWVDWDQKLVRSAFVQRSTQKSRVFPSRHVFSAVALHCFRRTGKLWL
jgi:hypothetical protein